MKFSHALKFNANSAWKDHYINYNRLKKLIYRKEAEETKGLSLNFPDVANRTSIGTVSHPAFLLHGPPSRACWSCAGTFNTSRLAQPVIFLGGVRLSSKCFASVTV